MLRASFGGQATARVFLSYARADIKKAKRLADALTSAGHSVWWDFQIDGGARFGDAIDSALTDADGVIVLWSRKSIQSSWVRDEAAAGRDTNRLIPILIDPVDPPLGFRQYQSISLVDWSGRGHPPSMARILSAIATHGSTRAEPKAVSSPTGKRPQFLGWRALLIAFSAVAAGFAAFLWFRTGGRSATPSVVVGVSKSAPQQLSAELAHDVILDLGRFQEGPLSGISIRQSGGNDSGIPDYRIEVGLRTGGDDRLHGDATMLDRKDAVVWTTGVDVPTSSLADLHQQISAQIGSVLACSVRVPSMRPMPTGELLKLYLSGCASLYGSLGQPLDKTYGIFQRIAAEQPDLADGWAGLAVLEAEVPPQDTEYPRVRRDAIAHLARAKRLNPRLDLVYAAETRLHSFDKNYDLAIDALERGVEEYPDSALLNNDLAAAYQRVGRTSDSLENAHNAFSLDPLSAGALSSFVFELAFSGNVDAAEKQLKQAERIWPGSEPIEIARYYLNLRYGDPAEAIRVAADNPEVIDPTAAQQALIAARLSPTSANKDRAVATFEAAYRAEPGQIMDLLQALGTFDRVDEAFATMQIAPTVTLVANSDTFFRPNMRSIRADPRFMGVANRLGLTKVWKQTGKWPDFCRDADLPYDCRREAAKFAN